MLESIIILSILGVIAFFVTIAILIFAIVCYSSANIQNGLIQANNKVKNVKNKAVDKTKEKTKNVVHKVVKKKPKEVPEVKIFHCPKCDEVIDEDSLYCKHCGKKIPKEKAE